MSQGVLSIGVEIDLEIVIPGFRGERDAATLDWSRKLAVAPGTYRIQRVGRSDVGLKATDGADAAHYYQIAGPMRAWVRHNYLLAGGCADWPWDLMSWTEPIDWTEAWAEYLRMRVEGRAPSKRPRRASGGGGAGSGGEVAPKLDAFGTCVARPGSWLPDFDDAFELEDESGLAKAS